jgi:hypothetical protein
LVGKVKSCGEELPDEVVGLELFLPCDADPVAISEEQRAKKTATNKRPLSLFMASSIDFMMRVLAIRFTNLWGYIPPHPEKCNITVVPTLYPKSD